MSEHFITKALIIVSTPHLVNLVGSPLREANRGVLAAYCIYVPFIFMSFRCLRYSFNLIAVFPEKATVRSLLPFPRTLHVYFVNRNQAKDLLAS